MAEAAKSESMEDILQSIKRIIEDDGDADSKAAPANPAAAIPPADVLELTQVIREDGTVSPITPLPSAASAPKAAPVEAPKPAPAPEPAKQPVVEPPTPPAPPARPPEHPPLKLEEALVSEQTTQAALAALKPIVEGNHKDYSIPHIPSSALRNGNTVEDLVLEALKPMLKSWLDEHLPVIVQKIVEKEVKRIVTFHQD